MNVVRGREMFWRADRPDSLNNILRSLYPQFRDSELVTRAQRVSKQNQHVKNWQRILPGTVFSLGPVDGPWTAPIWTSDLLEMQRMLSSESDVDFMLENWDLLQSLTEIDENDILTMAPIEISKRLQFEMKAKRSTEISESAKGLYRMVKAGRQTFIEGARGSFGSLVAPHVWQEINGTLVQDTVKRLRYVKKSSDVLGLVPKDARAFGSGGKVILVQPNMQGGLYQFSRTVRQAKQVSDQLLSPLGKVLKIVDFGIYVNSVASAIGTRDQNRTLSRETGKYAAGLIVGSTSKMIGNSVCGVLTLSTGLGGVGCYFAVLVASSVVASYVGDVSGNLVYEAWSGVK